MKKIFKYNILLTLICVVVNTKAQSVKDLERKIKLSVNLEETAKLQSDLGEVYFKKSDFTNALVSFMQSLKIAEQQKLMSIVGSNYNNISSVYFQTEKYELAEQYAKKAIAIFIETNDEDRLLNSYNSIANVYYMTFQDSLAIAFYKKAIGIAEIIKHENLGVYYKNLGGAFFESGDTLNGLLYLKKALTINKLKNDTVSIFSSTIAIAEFYTYSKQQDSAEVYLNSAELILPKIKFYPRLKDFYYCYSYYFANDKSYEKAYHYYKLFAAAKDSSINEKSNEQLLELETKYQSEKKELQIKNQQLVITQKQKEQIILYMLIGVGLFLVILIFFWYKNVQKNNLNKAVLLEKEEGLKKIIEAEEKERTRIAKDLHDGVVQDLTATKLNIQSIIQHTNENTQQQLNKLLYELDKTSKDVREISYQMMPVTLKELGLLKALNELCERNFGSSNIGFEFNHFGIEGRLSEKIEVSIYRICQELINNTIKHSKASNVSLILIQKGNSLSLTFEDNGVGFNTNEVKKGIGLNSLNSRVELVKGTLELDSSNIKGTTAFIRIPL